MIAMEATIFTGLIYDYLLPHAEKVKVAQLAKCSCGRSSRRSHSAS